MLRLLILMLLLSSCKHPIFSGKNKKQQVTDNAPGEEDQNKVVDPSNPETGGEKDDPGQGGEEVLRLAIINLEHDALFKTACRSQ